MDLTTPDAYPGNAYGWVTNQSGHALILGRRNGDRSALHRVFRTTFASMFWEAEYLAQMAAVAADNDPPFVDLTTAMGDAQLSRLQA